MNSINKENNVYKLLLKIGMKKIANILHFLICVIIFHIFYLRELSDFNDLIHIWFLFLCRVSLLRIIVTELTLREEDQLYICSITVRVHPTMRHVWIMWNRIVAFPIIQPDRSINSSYPLRSRRKNIRRGQDIQLQPLIIFAWNFSPLENCICDDG